METSLFDHESCGQLWKNKYYFLILVIYILMYSCTGPSLNAMLGTRGKKMPLPLEIYGLMKGKKKKEPNNYIIA